MTTMPRPATVVVKSVSVLKRAGLDERAALETVAEVAQTVRRRLAGDWQADLTWVCQIEADARVRLARLRELRADA